MTKRKQKMKKFTKINYILTFILVFCIGATLPILIGSSHVDEQHSAKSEVPYCVTPPTVPAQVTFDGETIDLRRYFLSLPYFVCTQSLF